MTTTGTTTIFPNLLEIPTDLIRTHANSASEPCIGYGKSGRAILICLSHAGISVTAGGVVTVGGLRYFPVERRVRERPGMFSRQPDVDRDRRRADLINRARLVRAHGWDDYRAVWSSGEVWVWRLSSVVITTYTRSSMRACNGCGPAGRSICGAWATDKRMSTTTADNPAGGSSTQRAHCE